VRALNIIIMCISVRNVLRVYPIVSIEKIMYMKLSCIFNKSSKL